MDVDASFNLLGGFGALQTFNIIVYVVCSGSTAWHLTGVSFTIAEPESYRCRPPDANGTAGWGWDAGQGEHVTATDDQCGLVLHSGGGVNETLPCQDGWEYTTAHGETTVVTDLNLVCDHALLAGTLLSIHFGGALAGSYILGQLSDIFGRRPVVMASLAGIAATGTALSFCTNYAPMVVLQFLYGCFIPGILTVAYVRLIEMFTPERRVLGQMIGELSWVVGILLLSPMAYLIPNWRHLQRVISLCSLPFIPAVWFSYESVRWLVQKGRVDEAEQILQRIAKSKHISHSGYFLIGQDEPGVGDGSDPTGRQAVSLEELQTKAGPGLEKEAEAAEAAEVAARVPSTTATKKITMLDLFRTPALLIRTLFVFYCWFTSSAVYYGFFINADNLVGDKYLNFFLISATEAPCYVMNYFVLTRLGRKRPLITYYIVGGIACVLTGAIPETSARGTDLTMVILVVAMIGKFFATAAFDVLYLVTAELYPTVLRNASIGAASMVGRAGGMVAPFIVYLKVYHPSVPMVVFGVVSLLAGVLVLALPETSNRALPETLGDEPPVPAKEENGNDAKPVSV